MKGARAITGKVSWGGAEDGEGWSGQMWTEQLGMESEGQAEALYSRATITKGGSGPGTVPRAGPSVLRPSPFPLEWQILLS